MSEYDVHCLLSTIPESKASGTDGVPSKVYKAMADILSMPLAAIFNTSLTQKRFPIHWKDAIIVPIPKTNPPEVAKLRYISLLPIPAKILEKLVLKSLRSKLESEYGPSQHGFRSLHSTTTALVDLVDQVTGILDSRSSSGAAILSYDFSRAFDNVSHSLLLKCFQKKGFPDAFVSWLQSYLSGRTAVVRIYGEQSSKISILKGVPQGSVLAPPLFCTFISSLEPLSQRALAIKYADDMNIILPLTSRHPPEVVAAVETETNNVMKWCTEHRLTLNVAKSKVLLLDCKHVPLLTLASLPRVKEMKILGTVIDDEMNWRSHTAYISKLASKRFYILRRLKSTLNKAQLHLIYTSLIRSLLEYASPCFIGIGKTLSDKLRKLDTRAHRIIYNLPYDSEYAPECGCIREEIMNRRHLACTKLFKKIESSPNHVLYSRLPLRRHKRYCMPYCRTSRRLKSFFPNVIQILNKS